MVTPPKKFKNPLQLLWHVDTCYLPPFVEFRFLVIRQRFGGYEMLPSFDAVELSTAGQFVVILEPNGLLLRLRIFNFILDLVDVLVAIAQPNLALVLLLLRLRTVFLRTASCTHDYCWCRAASDKMAIRWLQPIGRPVLLLASEQH